MGKTKNSAIGTILILLSALLPALAILLPLNLWIQIWTVILLLPLVYLGYLFIGIVILAGVGYYYVSSAKAKINLAFVALFAGVAAMIIIFCPNWFYMVFFASITLELMLQKLDVVKD